MNRFNQNSEKHYFEFNPWEFEMMKDYKFYFPDGN